VDALLREKAAKVSGNAVELVSADVEEWDVGHARVVRADGTTSPVGMAGLDAAVEPQAREVAAGHQDRFTANLQVGDETFESSPSRSATERRCRWPNHSARCAASCSTWRASSAWQRSAA
jgi:hypothetical protein